MDKSKRKLDINNYRIYRVDSKNIVIQRRRGNEWRSISYHGNSLNSLISALFELAMSFHAPDRDKLSDALVDAKLALVSSAKRIEEMVKRDCENL